MRKPLSFATFEFVEYKNTESNLERDTVGIRSILINSHGKFVEDTMIINMFIFYTY
jgi:hypothetical protein